MEDRPYASVSLSDWREGLGRKLEVDGSAGSAPEDHRRVPQGLNRRDLGSGSGRGHVAKFVIL